MLLFVLAWTNSRPDIPKTGRFSPRSDNIQSIESATVLRPIPLASARPVSYLSSDGARSAALVL